MAAPTIRCRRRSRCRLEPICAGCSLVLAAFAIYFLAMPVLGNMIASALFLLASMWLLSDDPGRSVAAARDLRRRDRAQRSNVFFVRLLKVQMPAGVFKQWLF